MAQRIKILDSLLASKIAAGEVVERPASVVKELIENSLDAHSTSISVYAAEGGKRLIRVVDNGEGIAKEDAPLAFHRHATSKISAEEDLEAISTMGFRGEALASISAVAKVVLRTKRPGEATGTSVIVEGGGKAKVTDDGCPEGTSIEIKDLFYNTPARLKFLRSAETEFGRILDVVKRAALISPEVRFKLVHGSSKVIETLSGRLKERISDLFGPEITKNIIEVTAPFVKGFIGTHEVTYPTVKGVYLYVNGRTIRDKSITRAIIDGYGTLIEASRYPFAVLDLKIPPEDVDVNIHPTKSEVRFKNPKFIYDVFKTSVKAALGTGSLSRRPAHAAYESLRPTGGTTAKESTASFDAGREIFSSPGAPGLEFHAKIGDVKNPEFLDMEPVGQLWGEFLIAQSQSNGGEFYLIDQHGAAERSAFERLKERFYGKGDAKGQMLLIPERIETTPEERDAINNSLEYIERFGFDIIPFGPSTKAGGETFLIKSVPDLLSSRSCASLITDLASELSASGGSSRVEERVEAALMRIACHSVIRGPRILSKEEGRALLIELSRIDFAGHCPHGRPVVKKFARSEIEAMFKR